MKIAIIGTGIAGLYAARHLAREHEITVFEANDYIGGHTHTVDVTQDGRDYRVDTGFIVFNHRTYPRFTRLLEELGVASQASSMSFSVHCEATGLEYNGTSLNSLFAQRRNLLSPGFHRMILDILRFNREAPALLADPRQDISLGDYLERQRHGRRFVEHYIIPMGAAIWSSNPEVMYRFPAHHFIRFFHNHGMLSVNDRPQWRVVQGGSCSYVEPMVRPFRDRIRLCSPVDWVRRDPAYVELKPRGSEPERYDYLFLACHSDQALAMLQDPTPLEREVLGAIPYQANDVVLHTDRRLLPRRPLAWAAWNYHLPRNPGEAVAVTYNMNILQSLDSRRPFLVTLNRSRDIDPAAILGRYRYHHPVFTPAAVAAQQRQAEINGLRRSFYLGAYWGYGFHEDGVNSAAAACAHFDQRIRDGKLHLRRAS